MAIPIVSLLVPLAVPSTDLRELVYGCDQSFALGDCVVVSGMPEPGSLVATISWESPEVARIVVEMPPGEGRLGPEPRSLIFRPEDEPSERYRAIGFSVGTDATRLYQAAEGERTVEPSEPASSVEAGPASPPPDRRKVDKVSPPKRRKAAAPGPRPAQAPPTGPMLPGVSWAGGVDVGVAVGNGFLAARYGASVGTYARAPSGLLLGLGFDLWMQPAVVSDADVDGIEEDVAVSAYGGTLYFGQSWRLADFRAVGAGFAAVDRVAYSSPSTSESDVRFAPRAGLLLQVNWILGALQPFFRARGGYGSEIPVGFSAPPGDARDLLPVGNDGPWRGAVMLGALLEFGGS